MSEQTESFISHLVELRDRLLRAVAAIVIVFICLMPWAGDIYDLLARPLPAPPTPSAPPAVAASFACSRRDRSLSMARCAAVAALEDARSRSSPCSARSSASAPETAASLLRKRQARGPGSVCE